MALEYDEVEVYDVKKIAILIGLPIIVVGSLFGLWYFGFIEFPTEQIEPPEPIPQPVPEEPEPIPVPENPEFKITEDEGLLPTTPQLNIQETIETESLEAMTPQVEERQVAQQGNLDDVQPNFRKYLEYLSLNNVLFIQNNSCETIAEFGFDSTYDSIIGEKC